MLLSASEYLAAIQEAELSLLTMSTASDPRQLEALLHHDFTEIGRSGRLWSRAETLAEILSRARPEDVDIIDSEVNDIGPGVILHTYTLRAAGSGSLHCSMWVIDDGALRARFHQGTPIRQPASHAPVWDRFG